MTTPNDFAHLLINASKKGYLKGEYKWLNDKGLYGGRSQDRTVDLLLVRLGLPPYTIDSFSGHLAPYSICAACAALIAHGFADANSLPSKLYLHPGATA